MNGRIVANGREVAWAWRLLRTVPLHWAYLIVGLGWPPGRALIVVVRAHWRLWCWSHEMER